MRGAGAGEEFAAASALLEVGVPASGAARDCRRERRRTSGSWVNWRAAGAGVGVVGEVVVV